MGEQWCSYEESAAMTAWQVATQVGGAWERLYEVGIGSYRADPGVEELSGGVFST